MTINEIISRIKEKNFGLFIIESEDLISINCGFFNIYVQLECIEDDIVDVVQIYGRLDSDENDLFSSIYDDIEDEFIDIIEYISQEKEITINNIKKLNKCVSILNEINFTEEFIIDYISKNIETEC